MNRLHRCLLFVFSCVGLLISLALLSPFLYYSMEFMCLITEDLMPFLSVFPSDFAVMATMGFYVFLCVCFGVLMLISLFFPGKRNELILAKGNGQLSFSKQAIESTVRCGFADIDGISAYKVKIKLHRNPEKTKVYAKLSARDPDRLVELAETVQNRIEASLRSSLGIAVKSVNVKVKMAESGSYVRHEPENSTKPILAVEHKQESNTAVIPATTPEAEAETAVVLATVHQAEPETVSVPAVVYEPESEAESVLSAEPEAGDGAEQATAGRSV